MPKILALSLISVVALASACSPKYGFQECTTGADCSSPQVCISCNAADAGQGTNTAFCYKTCTTDADCGDLGLKKPVCAGNTCGAKFCSDNPF